MKNNPYLLQVAEVVNTDSSLTADATKINEDDYDVKISKKAEENNVGYQETLKIDVKNIKIYNMETNI